MFPRLSYFILTLLFLAAVIIIRLIDPAPVSRLRHASFDFLQSLLPRQATSSSPVRIIDIDQASLNQLGNWPWPRTHLASLVKALRKQNAAAIGIPLLLEGKDPLSPENILSQLPPHMRNATTEKLLHGLTANDQVLAKILQKSPVIMGYRPLPLGQKGTRLSSPYQLMMKNTIASNAFSPFSDVRQSLSLFNENSQGLGALPAVSNKYGSTTSLPMIYQNGADIQPSFTTEMLRIAQGATSYGILSPDTPTTNGKPSLISGLKIGDISLPMDHQGRLLLHVRPTDKSRYIPAWKIIRNGAASYGIDGRLVIISSSLPQIAPHTNSALEQNIPQAELIAQSIEQVLQKRFLQRPSMSLFAEIAIIFLGGLIILFGLFYLGSTMTAFFTALTIGLITLLSYLLFQSKGLLIDPVFPGLSLAGLYFMARFSHFIPVGEARNAIYKTLHNKLPPHTIQKIAKNKDLPQMSGKYSRLPLLSMHFSGLEHIETSLTPAQSLTPLIQKIYTDNQSIIFKNGGMLDNHSGDHLFALWDQPCQKNKEINAKRLTVLCKAARELSNASQASLMQFPVNKDATPDQLPRCHIVLSTGTNWLGNIGQENSSNYSLFGASNAEAMQLQNIAAYYRAGILVTQIYAETVADIPFLPFPVPTQNTLKGQDYIYILVNQRSSFSTLQDLHFRLLETLKEDDRKTAKTLMDQCLPLAGKELKTAYQKLWTEG